MHPISSFALFQLLLRHCGILFIFFNTTPSLYSWLSHVPGTRSSYGTVLSSQIPQTEMSNNGFQCFVFLSSCWNSTATLWAQITFSALGIRDSGCQTWTSSPKQLQMHKAIDVDCFPLSLMIRQSEETSLLGNKNCCYTER